MRNRVVQFALSLALLGLVIQIVLIAPSQIQDVETKAAVLPTPNMATGDDVDQSLKGMHMIETQEGRKEWELWSDRAVSLKTKDMMQLTTVKTVFFTDSGVTFTVTGQMGNVQVKEKNLWIDGDVVVRSSNGYVFRSQSLEYDSKARRLLAPQAVDMLGPRDADGHALRLTGVGMRASMEKSTMEILRDVKAEKTISEGRKALIRSQSSLFSGKDKTAKFAGDVILDMDSMRITGPEAEFEYDRKGDTVKSVYFSGGTRVSDTDKWATSQNLKVDFDTNKFTFRGSPRVVQNNDELRGEEIIFIDGGKQVQVHGARAKVDGKHMGNPE